ncbi:MAG: alpha/beta hydrolase [Gammaproteobacteria bacterium]|nr:alpha/beta hydrolase [Gammaproteobacteria bacterium]
MNTRHDMRNLGMSILLLIVVGCTTTSHAPTDLPLRASSADGSEIHYGVRGKGDLTLVFIHCWTCNHAFWNRQVEYFERDYRVVWLDLAGHGESGSQRTQYTMRGFGEDVAAVVNAIGAERVILVGHSMGGPVAVEAAELLGDRVIGIVGVDTFYTDFEYPRDEAKIAEFVKPFENNFTGTSQYLVRSMFTAHADPETIDWVVSQFSGDRRDMGVSAMYEIFRWNADNVPAILQRNAARLRNINGAPTGKETAHDPSVTLIPQVGHFVAQAKPDAFNQALEHIIVDDLARH